MKKILSLILIVCIIASFGLVAFAAEYEFPNPSRHLDAIGQSYGVVFKDDNTYYFATSTKDAFYVGNGYDDGTYMVLPKSGISKSNYTKYRFSSGSSWVKTSDSLVTGSFDVIWTANDLYWQDGTLFMSGSYQEPDCDGTICPASDLNLDNICDDCGNILTMSLRSTEYDYAVSLAEGRASFGYPFWAIFQQGDRYVIHVSKNPMTSPDGEILDGTDMMYTKTVANDNGSFSLTGWYNGYYSYTDSFVYANHTIGNFPLVPPFLEQMEEPIAALGMEVTKTMMTILSGAVLLMASLVGLVLLKKFSRRFQN